MRKLIFSCRIPEYIKRYYGKGLFDVVRSLELVEILTMDFNAGKKTGVLKALFYPGYSYRDISIPDGEIVAVLQEGEHEAYLLTRGTVPEHHRDMARQLPRDVIWTTPMVMNEELITYSVIGEEEDLKKIVQLIKELLGEVVDISYEKAALSPHSLMQTLTPRQQEILLLAKKNGYYEEPRTATLEDLSRQAGVSKATVAEHLRKAENQIINDVLTGY